MSPAPSANGPMTVARFLRATLGSVQANIFIAMPNLNDSIYAIADRALENWAPQSRTRFRKAFNRRRGRGVTSWAPPSSGSLSQGQAGELDRKRILRSPASGWSAPGEFSFGTVNAPRQDADGISETAGDVQGYNRELGRRDPEATHGGRADRDSTP